MPDLTKVPVLYGLAGMLWF